MYEVSEGGTCYNLVISNCEIKGTDQMSTTDFFRGELKDVDPAATPLNHLMLEMEN